MGSHTCTVRIAGRDFTLTSQESDEKTRRIAAYVDRKILEASSQTLASREISAVIAALSIAEELLDAQDDNQRLRNELYEARKDGKNR
jgi:cell division protein ZapA (FtsZ GTPase activity inhibitor)